MVPSDGVDFGDQVLFSENAPLEDPGGADHLRRRLLHHLDGTDHRLNVESSSNGVNFGDKVAAALVQRCRSGTDRFGGLEIAWAGTDKDHHLNVESSSNGVNFGNQVQPP